MPPAPEAGEIEIWGYKDLPVPHAPEFLGQGRAVSKGEPVPHALQPHATGHALDKGKEHLGLGEPTPRQINIKIFLLF